MPVREALALIEASPPERDVKALIRLVVEFAESSPGVHVTLDPQYIPVGASEECDALVIGHYIAGAVRFDLDHPEQAADPTADVVPALEAVMRYQGKAGAPDCATPLLERIQALSKAGHLSTLVEPGAARRQE